MTPLPCVFPAFFFRPHAKPLAFEDFSLGADAPEAQLRPFFTLPLLSLLCLFWGAVLLPPPSPSWLSLLLPVLFLSVAFRAAWTIMGDGCWRARVRRAAVARTAL